MDQGAKGRPDFVFLDTPMNDNLMLSCSKIIADFEAAAAIPHNLQVIQVMPFDDDPELCFIARFLTDKNTTNHSRVLKQKIESFFLFHENKRHGIVVMIPIMRHAGTPLMEHVWGRGNNPVPTDLTDDQLDQWIESELRNYALSVDMLSGDVLGRYTC